MGIRQTGIIDAISGICFSEVAHACTVCDSTTARQVRASLFNEHFIHTLGMVALPCAFLCVAVAGINFGMPDLETAAAAEQGNDFCVLRASSPGLLQSEAEQ